MANKSVLTVEITGIVSDLQKKLTVAENSLNKFGNNDAIQGLKAKFTELETQLKKIGEYNGQKMDQGGFERLLSKAQQFDTELGNLTKSFKAIKNSNQDIKSTFFPQEILNDIQAADGAIKKYKTTVQSIQQPLQALNRANEELENVNKRITQNAKKQNTVQGQIAKARQQNVQIEKQLAGITKKKNTTSDAQELAKLTQLEQAYKSQLVENGKTITAYNAQLRGLKNEAKLLSSTQQTTKAKIDELKVSLQDQGASTEKVQAAYTELLTIARNLDSSLNDLGDEYSEGNEKKLLQRLQELQSQGFKKLDQDLDATIASLGSCSSAEQRLTSNIKNNTQALKQQDAAMDNIGSLQSRISQYIGMEGIINALTRALRSAFETVKELDAQMTEMAVVTDLDIGDYWEQLADHTDRASELGLAIKDVYEAETLYYQQGLKTNQVVEMSTETLKMARIAGLSAKDATDKMTAALRGFNMELNETSTKKVADVYSELAAITASDVNEISEAMTKTASIAYSAGMEFETTAAFLSQIIETTRESAETAGTALKTVIARFQELKKDPSEIGEVDGEIVDANKIETALRSVGVALRDANGQFRDLDDVFLELASKWNTLDTNTQRYVATIAAGSRQQSRFIAMMQDYARTQELVAAANDSAGASAAQFEKTLESLQTKLNQLENAWNTFTMGLMNNQLIKTAIDALTGLLNAINKVFETLDNIPVAGGLVGFAARIGLIIGGLILLDKVLKNFFLSMKNQNSILASAGAALRGYALDGEGVRITVEKLSASEKRYIATLTEEQAARYQDIVATEMSNGATRAAAATKAQAIITEETYIATLTQEEAARYAELKATNLSANMSYKQAMAKAQATMAEEAYQMQLNDTQRETYETIMAEQAQINTEAAYLKLLSKEQVENYVAIKNKALKAGMSEKEAAATAHATLANQSYVNSLKGEKLARYNTMVQQLQDLGLNEIEAASVSQTVMAKYSYIKTLNDEQKARFSNLIAQNLNNGLTQEEAVAKARVALQQEIYAASLAKGDAAVSKALVSESSYIATLSRKQATQYASIVTEQLHAGATEAQAIATAKARIEDQAYINTLSAKQAKEYESIVSQQLKSKCSEEEARATAKAIFAEQQYINTLTKEQAARYQEIIATNTSNGVQLAEAQVIAKSTIAREAYVQKLNKEQAKLYEVLVAKGMSKGMTEEEASAYAVALISQQAFLQGLTKEEKARYGAYVAQGQSLGLTKAESITRAQALMAHRAEIDALNDEQRERVESLTTQGIQNGLTAEEAAVTALSTVAQEAETRATKKSTKERLKETMAKIGSNLADKTAFIWKTAALILSPIILLFMKKETKEKFKNTLATWAQTYATAACVAIVILAIAVFAALAIGLFYLCGAFDSASKRLEKATKELEATEEAVNKITEDYNNLGTALEELDSKYDSLEDLRRGTEEWNKAVQETNDSVMNLIDTYPELAALVENKGGVLTIDTESDEAKAIMQEKENQAITAKGALMGAKMNVAQLNNEKEYEMREDVIDDFSNSLDEWAMAGAIVSSTIVGAGIGAGAGAAVGALAEGVGAIPGLIVGAVIGGVTGLVTGVFAGKEAKKAVLLSNEVIKENLTELSKAYAAGEAGTTEEDMVAYIEAQGIAVGDAAKEMAANFFKNKESLLDYGRSLNEADAQMKAYYLSLATNAQQMLDLGAYTEKAINQMNQIVDEDITKAYYEKALEEVNDLEGDKLESARREFAKSMYGASARVDGNKILDELGNVLMTFENDEGWAAQMAAAQATQRAADAMAQVPTMIEQALRAFIDRDTGNIKDAAGMEVASKVLEGKSLTREELTVFKKAIGSNAIYYDKEGNRKGKESTIETEFNNSDNLKQVYGTFENYRRSLDADYTNRDSLITQLWENMDNPTKIAVYGGTTEEHRELFENEILKNLNEQSDQWSQTEKYIAQLRIAEENIPTSLASDAAQAWFKNLVELSTNGKDMNVLNAKLKTLLEGLTDDQIELVMSEINAIDKMDQKAWNQLAYTLEDLNISLNASSLSDFTKEAKEASNAILKIDFTSLSDDINNTYQLLEKVKEGGRKYSEDDYKKFLAGNSNLEDSFTKIGDEFVYVGGSMEDLTDALKENTVATLEEANRQLAARTAMSEAIHSKSESLATPGSASSRGQLLNYLNTMRTEVMNTGYDLSDFGIKGLSNATSFADASIEQLREWAMAISTEGGKYLTYQEDYAEGMRDANIQRYTQNEVQYNANLATTNTDFGEALLLQAIESGGVSNQLIEAYRQAIDTNNIANIETIGKTIANSIDDVLKENEGRDKYTELIDQVKEAIISLRQEEIDKLSEVNDSINEANDLLLSKIQEQIDQERAARENEESQQNIADMRSKLAYLGADTSGANLLAEQDLQKELAEAEQEMRDAQIDQAIENLEKANEKAAEQRERQIELLQLQLDNDEKYGEIAKAAKETVDQSLVQMKAQTAATTDMGLLIAASQRYEYMTEEEKENFRNSLQTSGSAAANWFNEQSKPVDNFSGVVSGDSGADSNLQNQNKYITEGLNALTSKDATEAKSAYDMAQSNFVNNGGTKEEFNNLVWDTLSNYKEEIDSSLKLGEGLSDQKTKWRHQIETFGAMQGKTIEWAKKQQGIEGGVRSRNLKGYESKNGEWFDIEVGEGSDAYTATHIKNGISVGQQSGWDTLYKETTGWDVHEGAVIYKKDNGGTLYIRAGNGKWYPIVPQNKDKQGHKDELEKLINAAQKYRQLRVGTNIHQYKTGGLADFTGPAWLDGTKSKPELVLNQKDTANFLALKDVLSEVLDGGNGLLRKDSQSGNNYFDIEINVDEIKDDYDVEQLADKIRRMIYDDASYRNVNTINLIR